MFSRSPYNHLPAGIRFFNPPKPRFRPFIFSPDHCPQIPSPLNSPLKDPKAPVFFDENAPPKQGLPHIFTPAQGPKPTGPAKVYKKSAPSKPSASPTNVHPRRKHPHKRLTFQLTLTRPGLRRKRPRFRTQAQLKRQNAVAAIHNVENVAHDTMQSGKMNAEDRIFIKQLEELRLDQFRKNQLGDARERFKRAQELAPQRALQHAERDRQAALLVEGAERREKEEEELRRVEQMRHKEEEHRREEEERRRQVEEKRRRAEEIRRQEEESKRRAEEQARRREKSEREYRARKEASRKAQEEAERRAQEQAQQRMREEAQHQERLRQEELRQSAAAQPEVVACLQLYDAKWEELKKNKTLTSVMLCEMPWPIFQQGCSSPDGISKRCVEEFIFHPLRRGMETKSRKDRVKAEMLRFHPDKFNSHIVAKLRECDREMAIEIAGAVTRLLTNMMAEEMQRE